MTAITFAIPFYRDVAYLVRAMRSVVNQTIEDWTLLVVDDGGPDGAAAVDAVAQVGDARVRYARCDDNVGLAGNWNRCLDLATTPFVTLLHADDELLPGYGAAVLAAHGRHEGAAAVSCEVDIIDAHGRPARSAPDAFKRLLAPRRAEDRVLRGDEGLASVLRGNHIFCPTMCFRRDVVGDRRFDARWRFVLDLALIAELLVDGHELVAIPTVAYRYRRHRQSQTALLTATAERFGEEAAIHRLLSQQAGDLGWSRSQRMATLMPSVRLHAAYRAAASLAHGRFTDARRTLAAVTVRR